MHREAGLGDHGLAGRRQVQREAAVERGVDREQADVAGGVDLVDHHHPALAHRAARTPSPRATPGRRRRRPGPTRGGRRTRPRTGRAASRRSRRTARRGGPRPRGRARSTAGRRSRGRSGSCPRRAGRSGAGSSSAPGRPCRAARARARRRARRAASAGRCACRRAATIGSLGGSRSSASAGRGVGGEVAFGGDVVELPQGSGDRAHARSPFGVVADESPAVRQAGRVRCGAAGSDLVSVRGVKRRGAPAADAMSSWPAWLGRRVRLRVPRSTDGGGARSGADKVATSLTEIRRDFGPRTCITASWRSTMKRIDVVRDRDGCGR